MDAHAAQIAEMTARIAAMQQANEAAAAATEVRRLQDQEANQAALQAAIAAAVAEALAATAQQGAPPAVAAPSSSAYQLTPLATNQPMNFSDAKNMKVFIESSKGLDKKYSGKSEELSGFLADLDDKGTQFNWNVYDVPLTKCEQGTTLTTANLISEYGKLNMTKVQEYAKSFLGTQTRQAQADNQLASTIIQSLDPDMKARIRLSASEYKLKGMASDVVTASGIALLMVIITKTVLDSKATIFNLHKEIMDCSGTKLAEVFDYNIEKFHDHVRRVDQDLQNRGQTTPNLLRPPSPWTTVRRATDGDSAPTDGKLHKKAKNAKGKELDWTWCPHHAKWGQHAAADCHKAQKEGKIATPEAATPEAATATPASTLQAQMAIYQQDSGDESS
ncbi:hypothetical protein MPSEU_000716100 [Mayamaea pseudoterrestris]|nr:hypothetical protein MPSEU_000716100 [Mayamaea pseudoterrestris]